jgi:signal transduction histidine kinase
MKFTIQTKIILSNIIIIVLALVVIGTLVIQGMLLYNIEQTEERLIKSSNNSNLYIQQYILSQQNDDITIKEIFKENSAYLAEELAKQITRVQLYDQSGELLADSATLDILAPTELRKEVEIAKDQGEKAYIVTKLDEGRFIYFASPIIMENQQLGVLSFLYSLEDVDTLIRQSVILFLWAGILGLFILYFISFYLSKRILKPVYSLIDTSEEIANGNYQQQIDYVSSDEIGDLTRSFNLMVINIREKIFEINSEKHKLESVLSSIEDGVIAVDNEKNVLAVNDPAKEIFNIKDTENISLDELLSYEFMNELYIDILKEKEGISREVLMGKRYLLLYTNIIHVHSTAIGYIFVIRDISKIRELEERQRQFISSVSHELRTPLTTVIGYSDLLQRRGFTDPKLLEKSITLIKKEGERLLRLVDDLLGLSKLESMEFDLIKSQLDILQLLEDVVNQMRVKGKKYNNEIQFTSSMLPKIYGDYDRLKQVFINVIDNAIKYSFPGDIIQIYTEKVDEFVVIFIRDFGSGIDEDNLERIFEPFYRVDKVRSRNLGGSGLGLSIVKDIVENHGGTINIESKIDEGTLVIVKLPIS